MKKLFIISLLFASCQQENTSPPTCQCYEYHERMMPNGVWANISTTTPIEDFCSKQDGNYVYVDAMNRYTIKCN